MNHIMLIIAIMTLSLMPLMGKPAPVTTVKSVDLNRYLGLWYQFAYFPNSFQPKDCGLTTAHYSLGKKNKIVVLNTCYADAEGKTVKRKATGSAYAVDKTNSKLKVSFFWPFKGDYWIVMLDEVGYQYAVVSDPGRKYLWILTRQRQLDKATYQKIESFLRSGGWDMSKLEITGKLI